MGQSLYHYTKEFLEVKAELDNMDLDDLAYAGTLESFEANIADKMENVIKYQKELLGLAAIQKAEAALLIEAAKKKEAKAEALRVYMDNSMKAMNAKTLQAGAFSLGYKKGSEIVEIDESKLPKKYWVPQPKKPMGKPELKKLINEGTKVRGVCITRKPDSLVVKM